MYAYRDDLDYDLQDCLEYNPQRFGVQDIERVLAYVEGERDGAGYPLDPGAQRRLG